MASRERPSRASLASVRKRIDQLDERLLWLVNRRASLALAIGRLKQRKQRSAYDPQRETVVLRHVARANQGPLSARAVRHIFQAILRECRRRERGVTRK